MGIPDIIEEKRAMFKYIKTGVPVMAISHDCKTDLCGNFPQKDFISLPSGGTAATVQMFCHDII